MLNLSTAAHICKDSKSCFQSEKCFVLFQFKSTWHSWCAKLSHCLVIKRKIRILNVSTSDLTFWTSKLVFSYRFDIAFWNKAFPYQCFCLNTLFSVSFCFTPKLLLKLLQSQIFCTLTNFSQSLFKTESIAQGALSFIFTGHLEGQEKASSIH